MTEPTNGQESVALGTWIGREQAFNALAHHCSKARVACLKQIHDTEAYKGLNLTWDEFCPEHAGISRTHADRLISQFAEFGAPYFELTDVVPVSPAVYRQIAPVWGQVSDLSTRAKAREHHCQTPKGRPVQAQLRAEFSFAVKCRGFGREGTASAVPQSPCRTWASAPACPL